jgi:hypothetical protein
VLPALFVALATESLDASPVLDPAMTAWPAEFALCVGAALPAADLF